MTESKTDLFGEVVITWDDVRLWLMAVPRIDPDSPRAMHYVTGWDVPRKIRAAKLSGWFDTLQAPQPDFGFSHANRLRWPSSAKAWPG